MLDKVDPALLTPEETTDLPTPIERTDPVRRLSTRARRRSLVGTGLRAIVQIALMLAVLAGAGWATSRIIADKPERKQRPVFTTTYTVETVAAERTSYRPNFVAYGQTVAGRAVDLRALVGGEIVAVSPNLRAGSSVAPGESLVSIDRFQYEGAVVEAQSGLEEARARIAQAEARIAAERSKDVALKEQLKLAEDDLDRAQRLRRRGQGTQQQLDTRQLVVSQRQQAMDAMDQTIAVEQAGLAQQKAGLGRLEWALRRAERDLASTVLKAPFGGVVRSSAAEVGRLVSANDVVVSLYDQSQIEVAFTLNDARFGRLQASEEGLIGRDVEVVWTVGGRAWTYPATVERLGADITSARGGVEVFARLTGAEQTGRPAIRPGAFVEVRVPDVEYREVFALPDTALFDDRVYVKVDGKLVARPVRVAAFADDRVLVSEGIEPGDRVLTTRITEVGEGLSVREEGEEEPPARGGKAQNRANDADGNSDRDGDS